MGAQRFRALGKNAVQGGPLIIGGGLSFLDGDGTRGTLTYTSAKPVTGNLTHQARLAINKLQRPFRTAIATNTAPIALVFVDPNYLALHPCLRGKSI